MMQSSAFDRVIEAGTPEHQNKNRIQVESLDPKGYFRRARVTDQSIIDRLLLERSINPSQFSAAELYLELMGRSGMFLKSPSMERTSGMTGKDVGGSIASRIMSISRARDKLREGAGDEAAYAGELCLGSNLRVSLPLLCRGLNVLASHFGIEDHPDPRDLWLRR